MPPRPRVLRLAAVGVATAVALTTAACGETVAGSGTRSGAAATSSGPASSSGTSGGAAQPAGSAAELTAKLVSGNAKGTTVHLTMTSTGGEQALDLVGDIRTKDGGTPDAFRFSVGVVGTEVTMLYVDGRAFVELPAEARQDPDKPWTLITDNPSNLALIPLSQAFDLFKTQTSLAQYATFSETATKFRSTGPTTVGGVAGQGYAFEFDGSSLPDAMASVGTVPTTMVIDYQGRPLQVVQKLTVDGTTTTLTQTFSGYDEPVTISAPPADQTTSG